MVAVVLGMLVCVVLAVAVMALVAVPARRAGRDVLTERGEEVVGSLRDRPLLPGRTTDETDTTPGIDAAEPADGSPVRSAAGVHDLVGARG